MKAVIVDLDRTLLRSDKSVSEHTVEALRKCRERGILRMVASARPLKAIRAYDDLIGFDAITALNGATIALPGGMMEFGIGRETGEKILSDILRFPDIFLSIETSGGLYSNRDFPLWQPVVYDKFPALPDDVTLYKVLASSKNRMLYEGIERILPDDVYHTIADDELVQIMSTAATKWNGVMHMLCYFGVSPAEAAYFGDDNDDIEPITNCGLGVAVANAIPSVLSAADRVTADSDADGVAKFIEEEIIYGEV